MKVFKRILSNYNMLLMFAMITLSCQDEFTEYPTLATLPCESTNIIKDSNILTDFECQSNIVLPNVEAVRNPSEIQINKSKFVGKFIDGVGAWDTLIIDYGTSSINLTSHAVFKIKVKTLVEGVLKVKLEGGTSIPVEIDANVIGDNGWSEYLFDFSVYAEENYTKLVFFFNAGVETKGTDIYYIDDLFFDLSINPCEGVDKNLSIINDFDCQKNQTIPEVEKVLTPNKSDTNNSIFCGKYIDETGAWDAIVVDLESPLDLSVNNVFKIKIKAPVTGILKVKLEGGSSNPIEKDAQITEIGKWVEYSFDFSSQASENHTNLVFFFNAGVDTNGEDVYFIDDLNFTKLDNPCLGVIADLNIINDFNCQQNTTIPGFISNEIIDNPKINILNTSESVLKVTDDGTNAWDALIFESTSTFDLSTNNYIKIKVLTDRAVPLLAKLEGGSSDPKEVWGTIDIVGEWKEYTFNFSDQSAENHKKLVFFFNGGQTDGSTTDVYYIDDIKFDIFDPCASVVQDVTIVNDAECQQNYDVQGNVLTTIIDNPDKSGINKSNLVLEIKDNGTDAWDHLLFNFNEAIDLSSKNQLKIKIRSSKEVPLLAKLEGGSSASNEIWGNINTIESWTEYTFDFSSQASEKHNKLVFFFNGGQVDGTATDIYYVDEIKWE